MIELLHINAGYGSRQILFDITAELHPGRLIGIIGPNGCGKSTLLKTAAQLHPHSDGDILLDGISITSMPSETRARHIAYLSQGHHAPDMTVGQLVLHGRFPHLHFPKRYSGHDREIASAAMETLGIASLADTRFPNGFSEPFCPYVTKFIVQKHIANINIILCVTKR